MKPEKRSKTLLGITRSFAKMIEFSVPHQDWIQTERNPQTLFPLTVGLLGDVAAKIASEEYEITTSDRQALRFSAFFFDAYINGQNLDADSYLHITILASAAYYLSDLPGSSSVLAKRAVSKFSLSDADGLDHFAIWLLKLDLQEQIDIKSDRYGLLISLCAQRVSQFYQGLAEAKTVRSDFAKLRRHAYRVGTPRQLLLSDIASSVVNQRLNYAARSTLPVYSQLETEVWEPSFQKPTFLNEFWPAQRLLGEQGVFRGHSAVVQMPTSAGKTKATEVLIRSAFLSNRTNMAVIIAPFRALCHEIRDSFMVSFRGENVRINEISDLPQDDFAEYLGTVNEPCILVLTPEKLLYILRQDNAIAARIGLIIYDEGHQFDSGLRGVTYELLITSLKALVQPTCQVILISAVITNAIEIDQWLNGANGKVISGNDLLPNFRSIAFTSWMENRGQLQFIPIFESGDYSYFVPRILEAQTLNHLSKRETKEKVFPVVSVPGSIALYLATKLSQNGAVAVFCGTKVSVRKLCELMDDAFQRGLKQPKPVENSDLIEVHKVAILSERHLGVDNITSKCARIGVFTHHGCTPMGVRLAVEHGMKLGLLKVVICTSTLAQGVNLPIRYLIVSGLRQGRDSISVRDFQNLIGRAGRSGMHTEGSVIFADPAIFDERTEESGVATWQSTQQLLDPSKAVACASSLLSLFAPIHNNKRKQSKPFEFRTFLLGHLAGTNVIAEFTAALIDDGINEGFDAATVHAQLDFKARIIDSICSYVMSLDNSEDDGHIQTTQELAKHTLAYHLAVEPEIRDNLEYLFQAVAIHANELVPNQQTRKAYSKSLFGVRSSIAIHNWVNENIERINGCVTDNDLLTNLWPIIVSYVRANLFLTCTQTEILFEVASMWIDGQPYGDIFTLLKKRDVRFGLGSKPRKVNTDHTVEICENILGFEGVLVVSAFIENLRITESASDDMINRAKHLQKRLKYGLSSATAITVFEMGFADRIIATEIAEALLVESASKEYVLKLMRANQYFITDILDSFPSYYSFVWHNLIQSE